MPRVGLMILSLLVAVSAAAQVHDEQGQDADALNSQQQPSPIPVQAGRTADAGSGRVGQRQTREEAAPNNRPLGRLQSRVQNRVQSRLRNRIDRYYDPQAATSPFEVAGDQAQTAGQPRPR